MSTKDEDRRKLLKPDPSNDQILALVKSCFTDHDVEIQQELDSYDDRNWRMTIGGVDHLVKAHNGVESGDLCQSMESKKHDSVIHYQYAIMRTLKEHGITASSPVREPLVYSLPVFSKEHSPCQLVVSVYTWVEGVPMSSLAVLPLECIADAGRFLGRLHRTLDAMPADDHPAAKRYHQWDGKNTRDLTTFVSSIADGRRRAMVESVLEAFDRELLQSGVAETFRTGINHGDYNDANILLDSNFKVTGVIDFGDSTESWTVLDVSAAMAYAMLTPYGKQGRSISAAAAFLRGFHSVYPLTTTERKHLVLLIACRLACSVTLGAKSLQMNPENTYLLLHSQPAWNALEMIWGLGEQQDKRDGIRGAMNAIFDVACRDLSSETQGDHDLIYVNDLAIPDAHVLDFQKVTE